MPQQPTRGPHFNMLFRAAPGQILPLNEFEKAVLIRRAQGYTSREISRGLGYSYSHVKNSSVTLKRKLHAHTMTEAVIIALEKGLISQPLRRPDRDS